MELGRYAKSVCITPLKMTILVSYYYGSLTVEYTLDGKTLRTWKHYNNAHACDMLGKTEFAVLHSAGYSRDNIFYTDSSNVMVSKPLQYNVISIFDYTSGNILNMFHVDTDLNMMCVYSDTDIYLAKQDMVFLEHADREEDENEFLFNDIHVVKYVYNSTDLSRAEELTFTIPDTATQLTSFTCLYEDTFVFIFDSGRIVIADTGLKYETLFESSPYKGICIRRGGKDDENELLAFNSVTRAIDVVPTTRCP
jgi:hypothetical protein